MKKSVFLYRHSRASGNPEILRFPGFRLALAIASLAGMTFEYLSNLRGIALATLVILVLATGCDRLPGKPTPEERWRPATEVTDFSQLYALNCAGCHGADGRLGAARPLNDPLYLALVSAATLRAMIAQGVPGTSRAGLGATGRRPAYRQADRHTGRGDEVEVGQG